MDSAGTGLALYCLYQRTSGDTLQQTGKKMAAHKFGIARGPLIATASAFALAAPWASPAAAQASAQDEQPTVLQPQPGSAEAALDSSAAQDEGPAAQDSGGEIVVTGSRIARSGFTAPTPVTTLGATEIETRAPSSMADVLATVPSFRMTNTPATSGVNSRTGGNISADLRALGPTRTLVLLNGRRFVPAGADGVVDLKLIPSLLIGQAEVVTGGASAAWGSDAVAGVVNFILKDQLDGIEGSIQTGITERGDNSEIRAALAAGTQLLDGRLKVSVGGDYIDNRGIGNQFTRDWGRREVGLITNTAFATNGLPNYIIAPNVYSSLFSPGGLINAGPLRGTAFGPGGTPYQFNYGQLYGSSMIGGGAPFTSLANATQLGAPYDAKILMGSASFKVSPALELFTEVNAAWASSGGVSQQPRDAAITIRSDNAYLPQSVRQQMLAQGLATITVGRIFNDTGPAEIESRNRTFRVVGGARGDLGGGWSWDAYYQFGRNHFSIVVGPNNRIVENFRRAVDAVNVNGTIVCRSTITAPTNGCRPQNIFGDGSLVVDNYSFGTASFDLYTEQRVASVNLKGDPFSLWAGPVSIAVGAEYRKEETDGTSDALSQQRQPNGSVGAFQIGNQLPISGAYDLWEVYAEAVVPVLRDSALGKSLDLNGAVRRTEYSTSGGVVTWKAGLTWDLFDGLRVRGTRSRDIRAPNLIDLFQSGGSSFVNVFDRVLNQQVQVRELQLGNTALQPERADTWTAGIVYQPKFLSGFSLSVDYYNIKVSDAIGTVPSSLAVLRCNAGITAFCSQVEYNSDGTIRNTLVRSLNLNAFEVAGLDVEARYDFNLGALPGRFSIRALGAYVDKFVQVDLAGRNDYVGKLSQFNRINGVPRLTGNVDLTYSSDSFIANIQGRLVGGGKYHTIFTEGAGAANTINENDVPAIFYTSLSLTKNVEIGNDRKVGFFAVINNLFDVDPPYLPSGTIGAANETSVNPAFHDVAGRSYKVGVRFKL